jgi:hypothetical protein
MHARDLLDLAVTVAEHGPLLAEHSRRLSAQALEAYWTAAKSRLDRWHRALRGGAPPGMTERRRRSPGQLSRAETIEEVLISEPLTRVWTASLAAHDRRRGLCEAEAVARSVYIGHLEARNRALSAISQGAAGDQTETERIDQLRRRTERWGDVLVARLLPAGDVLEFAIDPHRCQLFADDFSHDERSGGSIQAWQILAASLRAGIRRLQVATGPNADLNARIAIGILGCFEAELFDHGGCFQSLWHTRLTAGLVDVQGLVDELLATPKAVAGSMSADAIARRAEDRLARRFDAEGPSQGTQRF